MGEVIPFPGKHKDYPVQSVADIQEQVKQNRIEQVNANFRPVTMGIIAVLQQQGVEIGQDMGPNIAFIVESVKVLFYKANGLEHPLQDFVTGNVKKGTDDDGDPVYFFGEPPDGVSTEPPDLIA